MSKKQGKPTEKEEQKSKKKQMTEKRKDFYDIKGDPFINQLKLSNEQPNKETVIPQFINIHQFVSSRAHELKHFTHILSNKMTSKLEHQLLPKHMRRRAMAHNHYRIPVRIRLRALNQLVASEGTIIKRSKCRKHRRKLKYLLHLYEMRQRKNRWIETHVWHAKRFQMKEMWGYKIPYKCSDKSERTAYKLSQKESACINDQSFYRTIKIQTSSPDEFKSFYQTITNNHPISNIRDIFSVKVNLTQQIPNQNAFLCPAQIIGILSQNIIFMIVHPTSYDQVIEQIEDISQQMMSNGLKIEEYFLNNFCLISKQCSLQKFVSVFSSLAFDEQTETTLKIFEKNGFDQQIINKEELISLNLDVHKLGNDFRMNERIFKEEIMQVFGQQETKNIQEEQKVVSQQQKNAIKQKLPANILKKELKNSKEFNPHNVVYKINPQFMMNPLERAKQNFYFNHTHSQLNLKKELQTTQNSMRIQFEGKRIKPLKWIGTQRTPYTHRKKTQKKIKELIERVSKVQKDIQQRKELSKERKTNSPDKMEIDETNQEDIQTESLQKQDQAFITIFLLRNNSDMANGFGSSYQILIPQGYGMHILRRFVYAGCKAIGLLEYERLQIESLNLVFPKDYPQTEIGKNEVFQNAHKEIQHYLQRPPSKRVNFQKINNPFPFYPGFISNSNENLQNSRYLHVYLNCIVRGVPQRGAMIFTPQQEDLIKLSAMNKREEWNLSENKVRSKIDPKYINFEYAKLTGIKINLSKEEIAKLNPIKPMDYSENIEEQATQNEQQNFSFQSLEQKQPFSRELIGTITSGCYSQLRGKGIGIGIIQEENLNKIKAVQQSLAEQFKIKLNPHDKRIVVLIRNPKSLNYLPCFVKIMS